MMDGMPMVSFANHLTTRTYSDAHQRSSRNIPIASSARGGQVSRIFNNVKFDVEGSNVGAFVKKGKTRRFMCFAVCFFTSPNTRSVLQL